MVEPVEREDRSAYDARKSYINVLEKVLLAEKEASASRNVVAWVRALSTLHSMCYAYCDREKMRVIRSRLVEAQKLADALGSVRQGFRPGIFRRLDEMLTGIQLELHAAAAGLMMPVNSGDDDDFDEDEFAEGSDL